jgi:hypothetical protein
MLLQINNSGQDITSTNYFDSEYNTNGKFLVSLNAGAFRLLVPDAVAGEICSELASVDHVEIEQRGETCSIVLDDGSANPYTIQTTMNAFTPRPAASDSGREFVFSAWISPLEKIAELACVYSRF